MLTVLCVLLVVALILSILIALWRERVHRAVIADLLDRIMARSYGEYVASTTPAPGRLLRRRSMSDADMAELERQRKGEVPA